MLCPIEWDSSQWEWTQELQIWAEGESGTNWGLQFLSGWGEGKMSMLVEIKGFVLSGTGCGSTADTLVPCPTCHLGIEREQLMQISYMLQNSWFFFKFFFRLSLNYKPASVCGREGLEISFLGEFFCLGRFVLWWVFYKQKNPHQLKKTP